MLSERSTTSATVRCSSGSQNVGRACAMINRVRISVRRTIAMPRRHGAARRSQEAASSRMNGIKTSAASQYGCSNENLTDSPSSPESPPLEDQEQQRASHQERPDLKWG